MLVQWGKVVDGIQRHMQEAIAARDKMSKFVDRLDPSDTTVKS